MRDMIVLLGAETSSGREIAKRLRAEQYYCQLMRSNATVQSVQQAEPRGIIIAGEKSEGAQAADPALLSLGIPVLAIGHGARSLLKQIGQLQDTPPVENTVLHVYYQDVPLFSQLESGERWIERAEAYHFDDQYEVIADSDGVPLAYGDVARHLYLLQYQIERNDPDGGSLLRTFAADICGCTQSWTTETIIEMIEQSIRDAAGGREAVCAMSGGLDSTVAAMLARNVLGDKARCVFVDTGLLREGESVETVEYFCQTLQLNFTCVDASERILHALSGITDMDTKWRVIDQEIEAALNAEATHGDESALLIRGTNYMDILAAFQKDGNAPGGVTVLEPLSMLFKDEIRKLGEALGLSSAMLNRQPFPGMGLAARIHGKVDAERIRTLRRADALFAEEIVQTGLDKRLNRYFAMLDGEDERFIIILRALQGQEPHMSSARLPYDLMERCVQQILKELPSVQRVLHDVTPGVAEWRA